MSRCPQLVSASLLAVLLAGCSGGGDEPAALPTLTPAPSPTATVPTLPPAARNADAVGAEAFVRFYFDRLNEAFSTSDPTAIRPYTDGRCGTCGNFIKALDSSRAQRIRGNSFAVTSAAAAPINNGLSIVEVFGVIPARTVVDVAGRVVKTLASDGSFHFTVGALREGSTWKVRAIQIDKS